tara:strand:+ start:306 stop:1007 length:702 start_codon:yes stop_codon:yes gene_type:complete
MKIAIHQANYFPYPGFFHKINQADVFVIQDDIKFVNKITNRNKIISSSGYTWINVPIKKGHQSLPIMDVKINNEIPWKKINFKKVCAGYNKAKFFHLYKDFFENLYKKEWNNIFDLNFETIKQVLIWLNIKTKIVIESELDVSGQHTERLVNVCKKLGADTYISGIGGKKYLDEKLFEKNKIILKYQNYNPIKYTQHMSKSFIPNLSIIDLLANAGSESGKLLNESKNYNMND